MGVEIEVAALSEGPAVSKGSMGGPAVITDARGSIGGSGMINAATGVAGAEEGRNMATQMI